MKIINNPLIWLFLLLAPACRSTKPIDTIPSGAIHLTMDSLRRPVLHAVPVAKPTFLQSLFGINPKTKLKNVTISVNNQTAAGGSTIGANAQAGADNSKTKKSATSEAETSNTGGQGSKVEGDAKSSASNKLGGNSLWWYVAAVGLGFALRHFGPFILRLVSRV